jgi:8-oxo-dGTP diphosphatase
VKPKTIRVVAGLISRERRLLVCQRSKTAKFPLKWEFPGGKLEPGENWQEALRRELREELGIEIEESHEVFRHVHHYPGMAPIDLGFFHVYSYRGEVINHVFEQIRWLEPHELPALDFLAGDRPLIERLTRADLRDLLF